MTVMPSDFLLVLTTSLCITFSGGLLVGLFWGAFRENDRNSTERFPRPGTQPFRPPSKIKPYGRSPDMLDNGTHSDKKE